MLVAANWLERANVAVVPGVGSTEIQVNAGATNFGLIGLINHLGVARKVRRHGRTHPNSPGRTESVLSE
jgi:hypothetical protein